MAPSRPRPRARLAADLSFAAAASAALILTYIFLVVGIPRLTGFTIPAEWLLVAEAIVAVLIGYLFARALSRTVTAYIEGTPTARHLSSLRFLINLSIGLVVLGVVFLIFGVSPVTVLFGGAFAGLIIGLAGQTVLGNLFAGLVIIFTRPFTPGDRISLVSSNWAVIAPSYPHEADFPHYTGVVQDIGLFYTVLRLEDGRPAHLSNALVINALIINESRGQVQSFRVRMTFPLTVAVQTVEAAVEAADFLQPIEGGVVRAAHLEIADLAPQSWDGVIVVTAERVSEEAVRDRVIRRVLSRIPGAGARSEPGV